MKLKEVVLGVLSLVMTMTAFAVSDYITLGKGGDSNGTSGYSGTLMKLNVGEYSYDEPVTYGENDYVGGESSVRRTVYMGMTGISWSEKNDKPCDITATSTSLESTIYQVNKKSKEICSGSSGNSKTVKFTSSRQYVRGIATCTTAKRDSSKDRLKGIRIYAAEVGSNGSVKALNTYEEVRHTNCAKWFEPVYCSSGYVATGLKVYHNNEWFRGLGLKCRQVTTSNSPYKT